MGLMATLKPSTDTSCVANSLRMVPGAFHLLHQSNEWPNMELTIKKLAHGLGGCKFPCLIPFFNSGCKTAVHCRTLKAVFRTYAYAWQMLPGGSKKL